MKIQTLWSFLKFLDIGGWDSEQDDYVGVTDGIVITSLRILEEAHLFVFFKTWVFLHSYIALSSTPRLSRGPFRLLLVVGPWDPIHGGNGMSTTQVHFSTSLLETPVTVRLPLFVGVIKEITRGKKISKTKKPPLWLRFEAPKERDKSLRNVFWAGQAFHRVLFDENVTLTFRDFRGKSGSAQTYSGLRLLLPQHVGCCSD